MPAVSLDLEPHLSRLMRYARSLTRNRWHAEDLVQDTVVHALKKAHLFAHDTNLSGWLLTIMHNEYVSAVRRRVRIPIMMLEEELATIGRDETQTAPVELREIRRAIGRLPSHQRQALLLHCVHGLNYEEIAARLGVPLGTVQSRISRARQGLRAMTARPDSGLGLANCAAAQRAAEGATA
jgi:RNA polymerase sigma-70 factor (ECF subfamily)